MLMYPRANVILGSCRATSYTAILIIGAIASVGCAPRQRLAEIDQDTREKVSVDVVRPVFKGTLWKEAKPDAFFVSLVAGDDFNPKLITWLMTSEDAVDVPLSLLLASREVGPEKRSIIFQAALQRKESVVGDLAVWIMKPSERGRFAIAIAKRLASPPSQYLHYWAVPDGDSAVSYVGETPPLEMSYNKEAKYERLPGPLYIVADLMGIAHAHVLLDRLFAAVCKDPYYQPEQHMIDALKQSTGKDIGLKPYRRVVQKGDHFLLLQGQRPMERAECFRRGPKRSPEKTSSDKSPPNSGN